MIDMNNIENNAPGSDVDSLIRQSEFGTRFREARENLGLSTAEVAEELRLSEEIIKALENTQLDSLPAPTFTQGYIRSYAKLLKLPAEDILKAYDRLIPVKDSPLASRTALKAQTNTNDITVKLVTFGMLIAALILFVFWIQQADLSILNGQTDQEAKVEETSEQIILEDSIIKPLDNAIDETDTATASEIPAEEETPEQPPAKPASEPNETPDETKSDQQSDQSKTELVSEEAVPAITDELTRKFIQATQIVTGNDVLVMATENESWAEVEDANGTRLYFDLMQTNSEYKLRGQAPFKLFLGNAPSVTIGVNDQLLNLSSFIRRNNIAHIQVLSDGSISPISRRMTLPGINENNPNKSPDLEETANNLEPVPGDE